MVLFQLVNLVVELRVGGNQLLKGSIILFFVLLGLIIQILLQELHALAVGHAASRHLRLLLLRHLTLI